MPSGFVDKQEIEDFLGAVEAGNGYLNEIMPDLNDNAFAFAVQGYLLSIDEKLQEVRKIFGEWPALLDRSHPAYAEMYAAVQRIAENAVQQGMESAGTWRQSPAKRPRPGAKPLLLVPAPPTELAVS